MSSCSAASRREAPPSTCAITSMRMSAEYAFGIVRPQTNQCRQTRPFTGPWESCDSIRPEHALERLSAILERFGGKRSMNLEKLDGFIAALVCGPDIILPSEYLPEIWG